MKTRVQFVTSNRVKDSYGITSGLFNSASFVSNFLNEADYESSLSAVHDSNQVDRVVTQYNPDVVIVEALWIPPVKFQEILNIPRHAKRRWIVRVHSKAPFLANEGLATLWISAYTKLSPQVEIAPNTKELTEQLSAAFPEGKFILLPNIYHPPVFKPYRGKSKNDCIDIGCFGAIRPMKNTYQQALAAIEFSESIGKRLRFHVNATRTEQSGENVLKNLYALFDESPHELVEHKWYKHREFLHAISHMDLGMQVSFSESFNIVTADFVTAEVPIIASDDIDWMPRLLKSSPTSHRGMVRKLKAAYRFRWLSICAQTICLKIYNLNAKLSWLSKIK